MTDPEPSPPTPPTAGQFWNRREELEREASALLGGFLFSFSRLEFAVSLATESLRRNQRLLREPAAGARAGFFDNLVVLGDSVAALRDLAPSTKQAYAAWARAAHTLRTGRNALVHGRWDIDPERNLILNVATAESGSPRTTEYDVLALRELAGRPAELHRQLSQLLIKQPI